MSNNTKDKTNLNLQTHVESEEEDQHGAPSPSRQPTHRRPPATHEHHHHQREQTQNPIPNPNSPPQPSTSNLDSTSLPPNKDLLLTHRSLLHTLTKHLPYTPAELTLSHPDFYAVQSHIQSQVLQRLARARARARRAQEENELWRLIEIARSNYPNRSYLPAEYNSCYLEEILDAQREVERQGRFRNFLREENQRRFERERRERDAEIDIAAAAAAVAARGASDEASAPPVVAEQAGRRRGGGPPGPRSEQAVATTEREESQRREIARLTARLEQLQREVERDSRPSN